MRWALWLLFALAVILLLATLLSLRNPTETFLQFKQMPTQTQVLDRHGLPLSRSYAGQWNLEDWTPLYELPLPLIDAFIHAEDRRFYRHTGIDWQARMAALLQNVRAGGVVRGASTISEQVVRILQPRPRTLWSRWLEGWEAMLLEHRVSKNDLLEFYMNEVPYASNRRGVTQAARFYFGREPDTLHRQEMQALAVLVRAPSRFDPRRGDLGGLLQRVNTLRQSMGEEPVTSALELADDNELFDVPPAGHFVAAVRARRVQGTSVTSTLDAILQAEVTALLGERLAGLASLDVANGAVVIVDHTSQEVLAWASGGTSGEHIDAARVPRQPGSTLKPFLYGMALEKGWTAATEIDDLPTRTAVGRGLHSFQNYSRNFHGSVTLRQALGNSLNLPAVRTAKFVGVAALLERLHTLGFASLTKSAAYYGEGLALGNGEVTLEQLVGAYTALAAGGGYRPLRFTMDEPNGRPTPAYSPEVSSLLAHILSDSGARELEFGASSVLQLPRQTAVKTGTSTDHKDAWAIGFDDRYVVGVWMGNLDRKPTHGLSGARGPALLMRSAFAALNRHRPAKALHLSPLLVEVDGEFFLPGTQSNEADHQPSESRRPVLAQPTEGLLVAQDPRLPPEFQAMSFVIEGGVQSDVFEWQLDGAALATRLSTVAWPLQVGRHQLRASVRRADGSSIELGPVGFEVR